jgi:hypothetical protein
MVITYYGGAYFKVVLGDLTLAINPPSKESKMKAPRFGADVVLSSINHPDWNGVESASLGKTEAFVIDGPGNYEVQGILFTGAKSTVTLDKKEYINTVYGFELDGIKIGFVGAVGDEAALSTEAKEILGSADMIFIPAVAKEKESGLFSATDAYKTAVSYSPNIIVPYFYDDVSLDRLLKEGGQEKCEPEDKATLKRRDLDGKEGRILVLTAQA